MILNIHHKYTHLAKHQNYTPLSKNNSAFHYFIITNVYKYSPKGSALITRYQPHALLSFIVQNVCVCVSVCVFYWQAILAVYLSYIYFYMSGYIMKPASFKFEPNKKHYS